MGNYNLFRLGIILLVLGVGNYVISTDKLDEYSRIFSTEQILTLELKDRFELYKASVAMGRVMFFAGIFTIGSSLILKKLR